MDSIEQKYEKAFEQVASIQPIFPENAKRQMAEMVEIIARSNKNIQQRLNTNQHFGQKAGFVAEEFIAETYNLDASLNNDPSRALTDRYPEWKEHGLKGNDNPDLVIVEDGQIVSKAQSKFDKTPKRTAGQLSQKNPDGTVKYGENDTYLAPSDQVEDIKEYASEMSRVKGEAGDAALEETFRQTSKKTKSRIERNGTKSQELSKAEADRMGKGDLEKLKKIESEYQTKSTLKQMGNAAIGAAAMSAVVSGSINTIRYIQLAKEGKITSQEAAIKIVSETVASAADSAIKASANTGIQSLIVRYGSEKAAIQILTNQGLKSMLKTNAVTVGVICAVDLVKDLVSLGMGSITKEQFYERQGKGVLTTASGVLGGALGTAGAAGIATAFGAASGTMAMTVVSVIGGMSGGLIAGLAMSFAIENGIERPYRELVSNTQALTESAAVLDEVSQNMFKGQVLFSRYLENDVQLEEALQDQMRLIDESGSKTLEAITKI